MERTPPLTKAQVVALFEAFDGPSQLAAAISVPVTTAHTWKRKGAIPSWRLPAVVAAALARGIEVPPKRARAA